MLRNLILIILSVDFVNLEQTADSFPACPRHSPDLSDCIFNTLLTLKSRFPTGRLGPGFTIDPLDPFYLKEFEVLNNRLLKIVYYDIFMSGVTDFDLQKIRATLNGNYLRVEDHVQIPRVNMTTKYRISGPFQFPQTGVMDFSLINFKVHGDTRVKLYTRDGVEYAEVDSVKLTIDSTKLDDVKFSLPFGRVRELGFFSKRFVKLFGERMSKIAYRILEKRVDTVHIDTVNRFLKDVPANYFLSE